MPLTALPCRFKDLERLSSEPPYCRRVGVVRHSQDRLELRSISHLVLLYIAVTIANLNA